MSYVVNPTFRPILQFAVRVKSQEIRRMQIDAATMPQLASLLIKVAAAKEPSAFEEQMGFLTQTGILVPPDAVPSEVTARFPLSADLLDLIPSKYRAVPENLIVNRDNVFLQTTKDRPEAPWPGIPPATTFPTEFPLIWVFDPGTRMWTAYHTDAETVARIQSADISKFDADTLELLWQARILTTESDLAGRQAHWDTTLTELHDGYAVVRDILPPLALAAARQYTRAMEAEGYMLVDHDQVVDKRFIRHNDDLFRFIHRQTGYLMRRITSELIIPSYSYLAAYREEAELERHKDRPQCRWNASLLVDMNDEAAAASSWPIYLETVNGTKEVRLDFGDAVIYKGTDVPHWRPKANGRERQTLVLLHYVPFDFTGSLD